MDKLKNAKLILEEYKRAINPILDHFESASIKSLRLKQGNMLTSEEYHYLDQRIAEAESILRGVLSDYEELMYEALDEKEDLE